MSKRKEDNTLRTQGTGRGIILDSNDPRCNGGSDKHWLSEQPSRDLARTQEREKVAAILKSREK